MALLPKIHPILYNRLLKWWPVPGDEVYYTLLATAFPIVQENFDLPLDESGPELYRRKENSSLLLVLERTEEEQKTWILIVTTDWISTHHKNSLPRWILDEDLKNYSRLARNELLLSTFCGLKCFLCLAK